LVIIALVLFGLFRYWFVVEALIGESPRTHCSGLAVVAHHIDMDCHLQLGALAVRG
jgi:hypothetical protein